MAKMLMKFVSGGAFKEDIYHNPKYTVKVGEEFEVDEKESTRLQDDFPGSFVPVKGKKAGEKAEDKALDEMEASNKSVTRKPKG